MFRTQPLRPITSDEPVAGMFCPLCTGWGWPLGADADHHLLRECRGKSPTAGQVRDHPPILLSWQWRSIAEYEAIYQGTTYHTESQLAEGQLTSWQRDDQHLAAAYSRLDVLSGFRSTGRLLDIGAGTGAFVEVAKARDYDAIGIEPSGIAFEARQRGRNVLTTTWQQYLLECDLFDIVTLHDVWEHVTQPLTCLLAIKQVLTPDGMIVIEIPEWGCPESVEQGIHWRHVRPLQHLFLPSDLAAQQMFASVGLSIEAIRRPLNGKLGKIAYYLGAAK